MRLTKKIVIIILSCLLFAYFSAGLKGEQPVEDLEIVDGVGHDIERSEDGAVYNDVIFSTSKYLENGDRETMLEEGKAYSVARTRDDRQRKTDKQNVLGFEKVFLFSDGSAQFGLRDSLDILFKNPNINDSAYVAICKGNCKDILEQKIDGYKSSSDFIYGMLKNLRYYNFFKEEYKIVDLFFIVDAEGRNLSLPYIEKTKNGLEVTGLAVFKGDKMVTKLDMHDARMLNLLKEDSSRGTLTFQYGPDEYIDFYANSKRKVHCNIKNGKFIFTIDLELKGDIAANTSNLKVTEKNSDVKKFEKDIAEKTKKNCYKFIRDMQQKYELDCLDLGKYGAAAYGRHTGIDWNIVVSNSTIIVNIKAKIEKMGRGDY